MSKPGGEGAGVFLEVTRFPGLGLESGQAWSTGNLQGGRGGERGRLLWPGLARAPEETFLPGSQRLLGPGLAQPGSGRGRAPRRRRSRSSGVRLPGMLCEAGPRRWRRLQAGPGPEQTGSSRGQPRTLWTGCGVGRLS